jgi:hypothetical protein
MAIFGIVFFPFQNPDSHLLRQRYALYLTGDIMPHAAPAGKARSQLRTRSMEAAKNIAIIGGFKRDHHCTKFSKIQG